MQALKNELREKMMAKGLDPDTIIQFMEANIESNRATDQLTKDLMNVDDFYKREEMYTQAEMFVLLLKHWIFLTLNPK